MPRTVTRILSKHAAFWTAHLITGPRYRRTSSNTGTHRCIPSTFIATLRRENSGSTRTKQRPHMISQISLKDFPKSTERSNPGQEPRASCEAKWGPAAEPAWPSMMSLSTQNTCGHRGTGVFARPSYLSNSTIMASSSAQPSPASASSSTLIATPSASADKLVVVSSMPARPLSASPVPTSKTPTPSSPPQPQSKSQQQPTGLVGLGILNAPTTVTPARSISTTTPARRALSVNAGASATRLSERGFVEPHHSNVPRRAGTQVRRKPAEPLTLSPPATPFLPSRPSLSGPPPPPELEPEVEIEQPTTPRDTPNPNASRMPTHLLSLRLPPSPTLPSLPAYPSYHSLSAALSSSNVLPTSTALPSVALAPNTSALAPKSAPGSTQLPRRKPRLTRRESAAPAASKPDEPTGVDVFGPFEQPVPAPSSSPPPATAVAQPQPTASIDPAQSTPQATTREERRAQKHALLEQMKEEKRKRNERMCLQRVGATSGIEVGFLERGVLEFLKENTSGVSSPGGMFEEVDLGGGKDEGSRKKMETKKEARVEETRAEDARADQTTENGDKGLYVLLYKVSSDSEDDLDEDDLSSSSSSDAEREPCQTLSTSPNHHREELRLSLPASPLRYIDGSSALEPHQIREGVAFIGSVLRPTDPKLRVEKEERKGWVSPKRVRILTPRGRPEDAMVLALGWLAYGSIITSPPSVSPSPEPTQLPSTPTLPPPANPEFPIQSLKASGDDEKSACTSTSTTHPSATSHTTTNTYSPSPSSLALSATAGAARLLAQTITEAALASGPPLPRRRRSIGEDGRMIGAVIDVVGSSEEEVDAEAVRDEDVVERKEGVKAEGDVGRVVEAEDVVEEIIEVEDVNTNTTIAAEVIEVEETESEAVDREEKRKWRTRAATRRVWTSFLFEEEEEEEEEIIKPIPTAEEDEETDEEYTTAYTPAHRMAMHLLDEGEGWLASSTAPSARNARPTPSTFLTPSARLLVAPSSTSMRLPSSTSVPMPVPMHMPMPTPFGEGEAIGPRFLVDVGVFTGQKAGEEYEEEELDEEDWEEGSGGASGSVTSEEEVVAGGIEDVDRKEDVEGMEEREEESGRGRKVTWHGVPMPAKFTEEDEEEVEIVQMRGKTKSRSLLRPEGMNSKDNGKSKSKSRSRARRSRSLHPPRTLPLLASTPEVNADSSLDDADAQRRKRAAARKRRRDAMRKRREEERVRTYAGLGPVWRGVLSYDGLWDVERAMRPKGSVGEGGH